MTVTTPRKPRTRGKAAAVEPASLIPTTPPTDTSRLLIDRSAEAAQVEAILDGKPVAQPVAQPSAEPPPADPSTTEAQHQARLHPDWFTEAQVAAVLDRLAGNSDALVQCVTELGWAEAEVREVQERLVAALTATWKLPAELIDLEKAVLRDAIEGSTYAASLYDETGTQPQRAYAGRSRALRNAARRLREDFGVAITSVPLQ